MKNPQNETKRLDPNESSKAKFKTGQKRNAQMENSQKKKKEGNNPPTAKKVKRRKLCDNF